MLDFFLTAIFKYISLYQSMTFNFSAFDDDILGFFDLGLVPLRLWHWTSSSSGYNFPISSPSFFFFFFIFYGIIQISVSSVSYQQRNNTQLELLPSLVKSPNSMILSN